MTERRSVCDECYATECQVLKPEGIDGKHPSRSTFCMHYTCAADGIRAAAEALERGEVEEVIMDGRRVQAVRFGSGSKPTHLTRFFARWVEVGTGRIISRSRVVPPTYTGQVALAKKKG